MIIGLLLLVIVAVLVVTFRRRTPRIPSPVPEPVAGRVAPSPPDLHPYISSLLDRWIAGGVLSDVEAERIRDYERRAAASQLATSTQPARKVPAIAEALGYLGGVLGIAGVILLVSAYWSDWSAGVHVAVAAVVTALLVGAGALVHEDADPALMRLRWFLWTGATPAIGLSAYVISHDVIEWDRGSRHWIVISLAAAVLNATLWAGRSRPIQEAAFCTSVSILVGTTVGDLTEAHWGGLAVWALGIAMVVMALRRPPILPVIPVAVGGGSVVVGAYLTVSAWDGAGFLFVVASASIMVAAASSARRFLEAPFDLVLGIIGIIGLVQSTPGVLVYYARDAGVVTGLAVWIVGCILIAMARLRLVRMDVAFQVVGGLAVLIGPAITGIQSLALATVSGLVVSIVFIALGTMPGRVLLSMLGLVGLLVYVPWTVAHFFPGEGRAPLLISVSGLLIVAVAVVLARMSGRIRTELTRPTM